MHGALTRSENDVYTRTSCHISIMSFGQAMLISCSPAIIARIGDGGPMKRGVAMTKSRALALSGGMRRDLAAWRIKLKRSTSVLLPPSCIIFACRRRPSRQIRSLGAPKSNKSEAGARPRAALVSLTATMPVAPRRPKAQASRFEGSSAGVSPARGASALILVVKKKRETHVLPIERAARQSLAGGVHRHRRWPRSGGASSKRRRQSSHRRRASRHGRCFLGVT